MFDPKSAQIFRAVTINKIFPLGLGGFLRKIAFLALVVFIVLFLLLRIFPDTKIPFLEDVLVKFTDNQIKAGIFLSFFLWGVFLLHRMFFNQCLNNPQKKIIPKEISLDDNLAEFLDFRAARVVKEALCEKNFPFSIALLSCLLRGRKLTFTFNRLCLPKTQIQRRLIEEQKKFKHSMLRKEREILKEENSQIIEDVLLWSAKIARKNKEEKISIFSLLSVLAQKEPFFKEVLDFLKLKKADVEDAAMWQKNIEKNIEQEKRFWERGKLCYYFMLSVVQDFIGGYTINLDQYSENFLIVNPLLRSKIILHQTELRKLENTLIKDRDNCALIVGEIGEGRKGIVFNLTEKIIKNTSFKSLNYMKVMELDMPSLIGSSQGARTLEFNLKTIFNEAVAAGNIILVIPQIHNYIGVEFGAEAVARIDITSVLSQYLPLPNFKLIGLTTYEGLHKCIEKVPELLAHFAKVQLKPPSPKENLEVLEEEILKREARMKVYISLPAAREIIKLCDYYIGDVAFPKKAIDLLDEIMIYEKTSSKKAKGIILPEEIDAFFSQKFEIPVGLAEEKEKETLLNLENIIHQRLINQNEAVDEVANALRRARAEIKQRKRTIGNFVFLGPTGVGKTETAKSLARAYFGSEKRMIRLDMSEYQSAESINKLIGTVKTPGLLTTKIRENPFSLLLLDEIEKAFPNVLDLFLQVLDEGNLTDGVGRQVDFRHAIIIATSNAGSEFIRETLEMEQNKKLSAFKDEFIDRILRQGIFKPEFLNRFDAVVLFRPLGRKELLKIAEIMLGDIKKGLSEKNIEFLITPPLVKKMAELGYNPAFGAREMRRVIQKTVENSLAKAIISETIKEGDKIEINVNDFRVVKVK